MPNSRYLHITHGNRQNRGKRKTLQSQPASIGIHLLIAFFFMSLPWKSAFANMPFHNPIPGGIAVIYLADKSSTKPSVKFGNKEILVLKDNKKWVAVIGLSREILPGNYLINIELEDRSKVSQLFRVDPIPASMPGRIIELPEALLDMKFEPVKLSHLLANDQTYPFSGPKAVVPVFKMQQIVSKGQYVPYGLIIKKGKNTELIDHSWITYITDTESVVASPGDGVVEHMGQLDDKAIYVVLHHGMGMRSIISNLKYTSLKVGDTIKSKAPLGITAGSVKGRVDWQLIINQNKVDPLQFSPSS